MKRGSLPIDTLPAWARLNGVSMSGIAFRRLRGEDGVNKGVALVATEDKGAKESNLDVLLQIPSDLVLSLDCVETCAKSDPYLREILEAVGGFGKTARGAILIFLLVQITYSSPDFAYEPHRIGLSNPWTEYIKFMPPSIPLPTFYTDEEVELLRGTSLQTALTAKISALEDELAHLQQSTGDVPWCQKYWWDEERGCVTLDDWKYVDAVFRSRMVDFPGHGTSMVPCIDMANHAAEDTVKAFYEKDAEGNAVLQMRPGQALSNGEEVTISYGKEKAASEMLFSYGFLEGGKEHIDLMFVNVEIPDDDPLKLPKKVFSKETPIVTLRNAPEPTWTGGIVLWACVNEEDGLDFEMMRTTDGGQELCMTWKGESVKDPQEFSDMLRKDPMWDIFHLRAIVLVMERLESQYLGLRATEKAVSEIRQEEEEDELQSTFRPGAFHAASKLRKLESDMLVKHIGHLTQKRDELVQSEAVMSYLAQQADLEEDFS